MTTIFKHPHDMAASVGQELGVSDWLVIDQKRINLFADATGDHQWIHVDPERAKEGPFGGTIAHVVLEQYQGNTKEVTDKFNATSVPSSYLVVL